MTSKLFPHHNIEQFSGHQSVLGAAPTQRGDAHYSVILRDEESILLDAPRDADCAVPQILEPRFLDEENRDADYVGQLRFDVEQCHSHAPKSFHALVSMWAEAWRYCNRNVVNIEHFFRCSCVDETSLSARWSTYSSRNLYSRSEIGTNDSDVSAILRDASLQSRHSPHQPQHPRDDHGHHDSRAEQERHVIADGLPGVPVHLGDVGGRLPFVAFSVFVWMFVLHLAGAF